MKKIIRSKTPILDYVRQDRELPKNAHRHNPPIIEIMRYADDPDRLKIKGPKDVVASISNKLIEVTFSITGTGSGNIYVNKKEHMYNDNDTTYFTEDEAVMFTAQPDQNSEFTGWTIGGIEIESNPMYLTITEAITIYAEFTDSGVE